LAAAAHTKHKADHLRLPALLHFLPLHLLAAALAAMLAMVVMVGQAAAAVVVELPRQLEQVERATLLL
jgi:hypothetical protein